MTNSESEQYPIKFDITDIIDTKYYEKKRTKATCHTYKVVPVNEYNSLIEEIKAIARECCKRNWDCYDAYPVTYVAVEDACRFVLKLTDNIFKPTIGALPSGGIALEWKNDKGSFTVTFNGDGFCQRLLFIYSNDSFPINSYQDNLTNDFIYETIDLLNNWIKETKEVRND